LTLPEPRSVLVVVTRQIGDVLLTTPLIRRCRQLWPHARIDVLGFEGTLGMLRGNADVSELIGSPKKLGWRGAWTLCRRIWRNYDLALVAEASDRAHIIALMAARRRSGLLRQGHGSNWWKRMVLAHAVTSAGDDAGVHVVEEKLRLLEPWGQPGSAALVAPAAAPLPDDLRAQLRPPLVVMHVPSMWPYKQWAPAKFREVAAGLLERGYQVVLTGTAAARDQECIAPLLGLASPPQLLDSSGRLDLNQLRTLLDHAALFIGPDTSVTHLAAAARAPTLAVFGPTNPQRWGPWPTAEETPVHFHRRAPAQSVGQVTIVQAILPCVPCSRAGCENHQASHSACLELIGASQVLSEALAMLGRPDARRGPSPHGGKNSAS
jgi:heptosyltransferase-3